MTNEITRILLHTITGRDPPKNDSDHSYIMSCVQGSTGMGSLLPICMGRKWTRTSFHGTPLNYDSLNVFRLPQMIICSQDVSEVPALQVQLEAGNSDGSTGTDTVHEVNRTPSAGRIMP